VVDVSFAKPSNQLPVPPMLIRSAAAGGFFRANASFLSKVGFGEDELAKKPFLDWIDPDDVDLANATIDGGQSSCRVRHMTRSGDRIPLEIRMAGEESESLILARVEHDVEVIQGPKDSDDEATVSGTLHTIARIVEEQNPGYKCSILLVADGRFVRGAGPSLPEEYNAAIDGLAIGPTIGSCGTAIFWNVPVIAEDLQADPLWEPLKELTKKAGVAACWSHPFASRNGSVLGALALYSPVPQAPTEEQLGRLKAAARMTGLAVERGRAEEAIREQRERELKLEEQLRQAAKLEALGVLAGGIAHDFNNVLSTVLANAEFGRGLLATDSEVQSFLDNIVDASKRAGQLCQQMLSYAGRGSLSSSIVEIGTLIPELSNLLQVALSKKITLEYALLDQPVYVDGDENQLLQVIMNLVTNAAEAIGENDGRIVVSTELAQYDEKELHKLDPQAKLSPGEYLRLRVSDTGEGMGAETMTRIFDPFFTTKLPGRGLGLSAVRGIISRHGGAIQLVSELAKGTTFTVILPTVEHVPCVEDVAISSAPEIGLKRILVVDDESDLLYILSRILKRAGYEVLEAGDGQEALDIFTEHSEFIDCVLLDFSMPRLSGEEVQQSIRKVSKDLPIVMMSGFSEEEVVERFRESGISGCLQKPVSSEQLLETIRNAITDAS
jgi:signal transduction histidine kinase/ActR/RegA family two-component response regulator